MIDRYGHIMPADVEFCGVEFFWRLPAYSGAADIALNVSPLYRGFELAVTHQGADFFVQLEQNPPSSQPPQQRLLDQVMTDLLQFRQPHQQFRFDLRNLASSKALQALDQHLRQQYLLTRIDYIVTPAQRKTLASMGINQENLLSRSSSATQSGVVVDRGRQEWPIANVVFEPHYQSRSTYAGARQASIYGQLLNACQRVAPEVVSPAKSMPIPAAFNSRYEALPYLPELADFSKLDAQLPLLQQGRFLHVDGQVYPRDNYPRFEQGCGDACQSFEYQQMDETNKKVVLGGR